MSHKISNYSCSYYSGNTSESGEEQVRVIASLYRRMSSTYVCVSVYAGVCVVYDGIPKSTIPHHEKLEIHSRQKYRIV